MQTGSYDLDFYIWVKSDNANFTKSLPRLDFMNGRVSSEVSRLESNYYETRIKGTFYKNMDFRNYPFDEQTHTIEVEGFETMDKLVLIADTGESGFDNLINIPGWNLKPVIHL